MISGARGLIKKTAVFVRFEFPDFFVPLSSTFVSISVIDLLTGPICLPHHGNRSLGKNEFAKYSHDIFNYIENGKSPIYAYAS